MCSWDYNRQQVSIDSSNGLVPYKHYLNQWWPSSIVYMCHQRSMNTSAMQKITLLLFDSFTLIDAAVILY